MTASCRVLCGKHRPGNYWSLPDIASGGPPLAQVTSVCSGTCTHALAFIYVFGVLTLCVLSLKLSRTVYCTGLPYSGVVGRVPPIGTHHGGCGRGKHVICVRESTGHSFHICFHTCSFTNTHLLAQTHARTQTETDMDVCNTYIHILHHVHVHIHTHTHIHTYIRTCVRTYLPRYLDTYMHACMHACMHAGRHTYLHAYIHIRTQTHSHVHTRTHRLPHIERHTRRRMYTD